MCGIIGFFCKNNNELDKYSYLLDHIKYRGPDNQDIYIDKKNNYYFGHTRLAIIDLDIKANQPMLSNSERFLISYNGEIYNFLEIKKEIEESLKNFDSEFKWKTNSDTEVLLEAIEFWGIEKTLPKLKGMFAFAIFDRKNSELILARDRFGEKPLYFGWLNNSFFFSSDLNPIKKFNLPINQKALGLYFRFMYVPTPYSIFQNVFKLPQGSFLKIKKKNIHNQINDFDEIKQNNKVHFTKWFNPKKPLKYNFLNDYNQLDQLEKLIQNSVKENMISDAPIGSFLSGGIDSSLISILMQKSSSKQINTFSIEQDDQEFNEGKYAREVSNVIGSKHHSFKITHDEIKKYFSISPQAYSEPFADSSQIPSLLLSFNASKIVKVCLTGDAGDELFAGYNRHIYSPRVWNYLSFFKPSLRKFILKIVDAGFLKKPIISKIISKSFPNANLLESKIINTLDKTMNSKNYSEYFLSILTQSDKPSILEDTSLVNSKLLEYVKEFDDLKRKHSLTDAMCLFDIFNYLSDDILCKVDRASMFNGLETRVPFLSEDIFNFSFSLDSKKKIYEKKGKKILREILEKYLPTRLIERKKMGFSIPLDNILRNDLNTEVKEVIFDNLNESSDQINKANVETIWNDFMNGNNSSYRVYALYNFFKWKYH